MFGKALVTPVSMQAEGWAANGPVCISCLLLEVRDGVSGRWDGAAQLSVSASGSRWFFSAENYPVLPSLASTELSTEAWSLKVLPEMIRCSLGVKVTLVWEPLAWCKSLMYVPFH